MQEKKNKNLFYLFFSIEDIEDERSKRANSRTVLIPDIKQSFGSIAIDAKGIKKVNEYILKSTIGRLVILNIQFSRGGFGKVKKAWNEIEKNFT